MLFKTNKQKGSGSYKTKLDLSNMDSKEFLTHIFHTETSKTTNKQGQTKENSSGKALDYAEIPAETMQSSKIKNSHIEMHKKHLHALPHPLVQTSLVPRGILSQGFHPTGKRKAGGPISLITMHICRLCCWGTPQFSPMLNPSNRIAWSPSQYVSSLWLQLLLW